MAGGRCRRVDAFWERENVEERRVLIDLYGRQRFLRDAQPIVRHEDADHSGMPRRLLHLPLGRGLWSAYIEVKCPSTGHVHILQVPPTVITCHEAVAWTFDRTPDSHAPLVEA